MSTLVVSAVVGFWAIDGNAGAQTEPGQAAYGWAESCKTCHQDIYAAWAKTKHAKALGRLNPEEQQKECIGCHVTGPKQKLEVGGKLMNGGVQCESCHGASQAHVADPKVRTTLGAKTPQKVCVGCHSEKSPHFKGFYYSLMTQYSHAVKK